MNKEERIFLDRLREKAERVISGGWRYCSPFLDPITQKNVENLLKGYSKKLCFRFDGGYSDAERKLVVLSSIEDLDSFLEEMLILLRFSSFKKADFSHRDVLGSIMASGVKREKIGDIVLQDGCFFVFVSKEIKEFFLNYPLEIRGSLYLAEEASKGESFSINRGVIHNILVASLRIDAILAKAFNLSRTQAEEAISGGRIYLNWKEIKNSAQKCEEGDVITFRGRGRVLVREKLGMTKKDKIRLSLEIFS